MEILEDRLESMGLQEIFEILMAGGYRVDKKATLEEMKRLLVSLTA